MQSPRPVLRRGGLARPPAPAFPTPIGGAPPDGRASALGADLDQPLAWAERGGSVVTRMWRSATAGVEWTPSFVAFLAYVFAAITFRLPLAQPAIALGLVGMFLQRFPVRFPPLFWTFGAFIAWGAIGLSSSLYPDAVAERLSELWKLGVIVLVGANALRTRSQIRFYMLFCLACFALYPLRGAIFNYVGGYRVFGRAIWNYVYENPNDLAAHTLLWASVCIGLVYAERKGLIRKVALLGVGMLTVLLFMTQSRGGILGATPLVLGALAAAKRQRLQALVTAAAVAGALALFAPSAVWERMSSVADMQNTEQLGEIDSSADQRWEIWKVARAIIDENPVMGVGIGAYPQAHQVYSLRPQFKPLAWGARDTHSTYLNVVAETGFVGLGLFVAMFAVTLLHAERVRRRCRAVMPAAALQLRMLQLGLLAFFAAGIFGSFAKINVTYLHALLIWAFAEAVREEFTRLERTGALAAVSRR